MVAVSKGDEMKVGGKAAVWMGRFKVQGWLLGY